jgi:hypothetical protein
MGNLFGTLIGALYTPSGCQRPDVVGSPDWEHNVRWARRKLRRAVEAQRLPRKDAADGHGDLRT